MHIHPQLLIEVTSEGHALSFFKDIFPILISSTALFVSVLAPYLIIRYEKVFERNKQYKDFLREMEVFILEWLNITSENKELVDEFVGVLKTPQSIFPKTFQFYEFPPLKFFDTYNVDLLNECYVVVRKLKSYDHHLQIIDSEYKYYRRMLVETKSNSIENGTQFFIDSLESIQKQFPQILKDLSDLRVIVTLLLKRVNGERSLTLKKFFSLNPKREPAWVPAMKKVHAEFKGKPGTVVQFGDSITYSMAFWSPLGWSDPAEFLTADDGLPKKPKDKKWSDVTQGARDKGPEHGNYSGWRVGNLLEVADEVLKRKQPEAALVMIGTNDISGGKLPDSYRADLKKLLTKILVAHCVPIVNTIPPRVDHDAAVKAANETIRAVAAELSLPIAEYYGAIDERRPGGTWKGTLISADGVHPSAGKTNVYSAENLQSDGYALRNWVNFLAFREVYFRVLATDK